MKKRLQRAWRHLRREHATPERLAAGVAVGVLIGCSPFYGLHFWIGMGVGLILHLNKLSVLLGIQVSIPPLTPFLIFTVIQTGSLVHRGHFLSLSVEDLALDKLPSLAGTIIVDWLVGWPVVGGVLALTAFALSLSALRRFQGRQR